MTTTTRAYQKHIRTFETIPFQVKVYLYCTRKLYGFSYYK